MKNPSRVRLSGPLQEFGLGFVGELERLVGAAACTGSGAAA
jgi:hypothetical protein